MHLSPGLGRLQTERVTGRKARDLQTEEIACKCLTFLSLLHSRRKQTSKIFSFSMLCYAKSLQSCPTLCEPIDGRPPGSPVPRIIQARRVEWVAISFSNAWKWKEKVKSLSRVRLLATPWTAAYQVPLSMGFSRQEYWSGVPLPSPYKFKKRFLLKYCVAIMTPDFTWS